MKRLIVLMLIAAEVICVFAGIERHGLYMSGGRNPKERNPASWKSETEARKNAVTLKKTNLSKKYCSKCNGRGYYGKSLPGDPRRLRSGGHIYVQCPDCEKRYNEWRDEQESEQQRKKRDAITVASADEDTPTRVYRYVSTAIRPATVPEIGEIFKTDEEHPLVIEQVIDSKTVRIYYAIHGKHVWESQYRELERWHGILKFKKPIPYVDGDAIKGEGYFKYIGPISYTSVLGARITVRGFECCDDEIEEEQRQQREERQNESKQLLCKELKDKIANIESGIALKTKKLDELCAERIKVTKAIAVCKQEGYQASLKRREKQGAELDKQINELRIEIKSDKEKLQILKHTLELNV